MGTKANDGEGSREKGRWVPEARARRASCKYFSDILEADDEAPLRNSDKGESRFEEDEEAPLRTSVATPGPLARVVVMMVTEPAVVVLCGEGEGEGLSRSRFVVEADRDELREPWRERMLNMGRDSRLSICSRNSWFSSISRVLPTRSPSRSRCSVSKVLRSLRFPSRSSRIMFTPSMNFSPRSTPASAHSSTALLDKDGSSLVPSGRTTTC
mmetsp:Transcript_38244/g.61958  ORF Transcript_38244/g.61958 Transcript_38244/m.61958 type:complete len:212 (+) Transcript_38244:472-1107(+)